MATCSADMTAAHCRALQRLSFTLCLLVETSALYCLAYHDLVYLQVYGDAVIDEAPMLIISNYHATVFLKRSEHVQDKRLWASRPVWWDQQQPTARSCWL